jgi:hypothetical protein
MKNLVETPNWFISSKANQLRYIHKKHINIAIYERNIDGLAEAISIALEQKIEIQASGSSEAVLESVKQQLLRKDVNLLIQDIAYVLDIFQKITCARTFKLALLTIHQNMCRKFHTDVVDLRLLCTYSGPGTLWLTEDNVNRKWLTCSPETD